MPVSFAVHVKECGRADIEVLDSRKLSMEIKAKQVKGKSITVKYKDGAIDKGPLKTEKYIKGPFDDKVNTIHYACVADTLLSLRREVREIHRKRERSLPVKPPEFLKPFMEDIKLPAVIRQTRYLHGLPDTEKVTRFKEQMKEKGYIRVSPELAAQAKKFKLPRYTLQKDGTIEFAHDVQPGDKTSLFLMGKLWAKMLDILVNEKPVYCLKELLVAMKAEAKYEASIAKKERDKTVFVSVAKKLACFLEAAVNHNLSHLFKGNAVKKENCRISFQRMKKRS